MPDTALLSSVLTQWFQDLSQTVGAYLPSLLASLLVLVGGWVAAIIISSVVQGILNRTTLDNKIYAWMGSEPSPTDTPIEKQMGTLVYYLVMVFVAVAFFQTLGLTVITEPLNQLLGELFTFAPRLIGAGALLACAWVLGSILKNVLFKSLTALKIDEKVNEQKAIATEGNIQLSRTISETVYWLVYLLFLPAIIESLSLQGVLSPINSMMSELLGFIPNIVNAAIIVGVGLLLARIIQKVATNLLATAGADLLSEKVGLSSALGQSKLSNVLGMILYAVVLVPVIILALDALALEAITRPATNMLNIVMESLPVIFAAGLIVMLSIVIGNFVGHLSQKILAGAGFDNILFRLGIHKMPPDEGANNTPSRIAGTLVQAAVVVFGFTEAFNLLGFVSINAFVADFMVMAGHILMGLVIFGIGLFVANWTANTIQFSGTGNAHILSVSARVAILFLTGAMALRQMGLANDIINLTFGLLLGAVAVATALAFGLGGRDVAARHLDRWLTSLGSRERADAK